MDRVLSFAPRYALVGAGFALLNMAMIIALNGIGIHYAIAILIAGATLVPISYWPHIKFTYQVSPSIGSFVRYVGAQLMNTPIVLAGMFVLTDMLGIPVAISTPTLILAIFAYNLHSSYWAIVLNRPAKEGRS
jgi:putative flippase GtrA